MQRAGAIIKWKAEGKFFQKVWFWGYT